MNEEEDTIIDISEEAAQKMTAAEPSVQEVPVDTQVDFGVLNEYLDDDDVVEVSYNNNGQLWIKSIKNGLYREDNEAVNNQFIEGLALQCCELGGKRFNMANPFLDVNVRDISVSFIHSSVAKNGIAAVFSKTAFDIGKIEEEIEDDKYLKKNIREFLLNCVKAHCNIIVCGDNDSGKEELLQYLVSNIPNSEKIVSIEAESQLNLESISKARDIIALKANNIANYSNVLSVGLKQKPRWVVFSEILNSETVMAIKNVTLSGHSVLSTVYADKAENVPPCLYGMLDTANGDQFLNTIYRTIHLAVLVRSKFNSNDGKYMHEVIGICEFYVANNKVHANNIYIKNTNGKESCSEPSEYLKNYLATHGVKVDSLFNGEVSNETEGEESEPAKNTSSIKKANFNEIENDNSEEEQEETEESSEEEEEEAVEESSETDSGSEKEVKPAVPINPLSGIEPSEAEVQTPEAVLPPAGANLIPPTSLQNNAPPNLMQGANLMAGANIQQQPNMMQMGPGPAAQQNLGQGNAIIQQPDSAIVPEMPQLISGVDQMPQKPGGLLPGFGGGANNQAPPLMGNPQGQAPNLMAGAGQMMPASPMSPDSPEAQLMGIGSIQPQKQEKPQLMGKPNQAKKKPFAKSKFYSGVGK